MGAVPGNLRTGEIDSGWGSVVKICVRFLGSVPKCNIKLNGQD